MVGEGKREEGAVKGNKVWYTDYFIRIYPTCGTDCSCVVRMHTVRTVVVYCIYIICIYIYIYGGGSGTPSVVSIRCTGDDTSRYYMRRGCAKITWAFIVPYYCSYSTYAMHETRAARAEGTSVTVSCPPTFFETHETCAMIEDSILIDY